MGVSAYESIEYIHDCEQCGKEFESSRYHTKFCSSRCRTANHREYAKQQKRMSNAIEAINELISHTPTRGDSEAFQTLVTLQKRIDNFVALIDGD